MADDKKKERGYALSDMESEATYLKTLFDLYHKSGQFCIQGIVKAYDRETGLAKVLPLVERKDGVKVDPVEVPVMNFCHGGFVINLPIFEGDTGFIIAGDKNAADAMKKNSAILKQKMTEDDFGSDDPDKNYGPVKANDDGFCKFGFGFFIPCNWAKRNPELVADPKLLTIASADKTIKVEIGGEKMIKINDMVPTKMSLLTDVRFNEASHDLIKEFTEVTGVVKVGNKSEKNVFTATPLSAELPEADDSELESEPEPEES